MGGCQDLIRRDAFTQEGTGSIEERGPAFADDTAINRRSKSAATEGTQG